MMRQRISEKYYTNGHLIPIWPCLNRDASGDRMNEEKCISRSCPSCYREVPYFWDSCQFCGNVFRKPELADDGPTMLCWGKSGKSKY